MLLLLHRETGRIAVESVDPGLHMLSSGELDDTEHPRIRSFLAKFRNADVPDPDGADWQAWQDLLVCRRLEADEAPGAAMNLDFPNGFGTRSSALIALPAGPQVRDKPVWLFADGPPDITPFHPVDGF